MAQEVTLQDIAAMFQAMQVQLARVQEDQVALRRQILQDSIPAVPQTMASPLAQDNDEDIPAPRLNLGFKPTKPDFFQGKRGESTDAWLFQVQQYFELCAIDSRMQVPFAASLLRDNAAIWWRNHVLQSNLGMEERIKAWTTFSKALQDQFRPINAIKIARDKLASLHQITSVHEYSFQFRTLVLEIPSMSEEEKIDRFVRGLKPQTRREVDLREPMTLNDAIRIADRFDVISYKPWSQQYPVRPSSNTGPVPMEIDAIQTRKKLTPTERERLLRIGACFYCRQPGHMAQACPEKKAPRLNALQDIHQSGNEVSQ